MAIEVKTRMGTAQIHTREKALVGLAFKELRGIPGLHILADQIEDRLGVISFYLENIHYNLVVSILSDRFGIQVRGGCACAGTYGHFLLDVSYEKSRKITEKINTGDLSEKPGWVRISLHPTMPDDEIRYISDAVRQVALKSREWERDYLYNKQTNEFRHRNDMQDQETVRDWFNV